MTKNDLSRGQLLPRERLAALRIPNEILENFSERNFLVVIAPRSNIIKINVFPTDSKSIVKVLIKLREFSPYIVKKIASIIRRLSLPNLFTSGMCVEENRCIYEAYIDKSKLDVSLDDLRASFEEIGDIQAVEITELNLEL